MAPMNWVMAPLLAVWAPVAGSPEACDRPAGVSAPKAIGMPPWLLK